MSYSEEMSSFSNSNTSSSGSRLKNVVVVTKDKVSLRIPKYFQSDDKLINVAKDDTIIVERTTKPKIRPDFVIKRMDKERPNYKKYLAKASMNKIIADSAGLSQRKTAAILKTILSLTKSNNYE